MRKHTGRSPSKQLPAVRIADGVKLMASVAANQGGLAPDAMQKSDDGILHIDLTRGHFDITLHLDGQEFGNTGGWGSDTLGSILGTMERSGYRVHCCLTCAHYKPSGMIDEWSLGAEGYCVATGEPDMDNLTHMLHECRLWTERGDRDSWFGREFTRGLTPRDMHGESSEEGRNMSHQNRRGLGPEFIHDLKDGLLQPILERVQSDNTLLLQIRNEYISIYYRGGTLTEIHRCRDHVYEEMFDERYYGSHATASASGKKTAVIKDAAEVGALLEQLPARKQAMDLFFGKQSAGEREVEQAIALSNNRGKLARATDYYFCDIEYKSPIGEFDMVGVEWPSDSKSNKHDCVGRLVLVELKLGDGALEGDASLGKHVSDINKFLDDPDTMRALKTEMVEVFNQQVRLGLIDVPVGKDREKKILTSFKEDETPMILLILANHDPDKSKLRDLLKALSGSSHGDVHVATANFMGYGLFKPCILPLDAFRKQFEKCIYAGVR